MKTMTSLLLCLSFLILSWVIESPVTAIPPPRPPPPRTPPPPPPSPPPRPPPPPPPSPPPPRAPPPPPPRAPPPPPPRTPPPPPPSRAPPPPPPPRAPPPPPPRAPPPPPRTPPPPPARPPKQVRCRSPLFPSCFGRLLSCPSDCKYQCYADCVACKPVCSCNIPGALCQDPRFVGGDGLTFYFHGHKDQDFCLLSDRNLHINGHFIGKRNPKLTRDFTWVQSIGILFNDHKLLVEAKKTSIWNDNEEHLFISYDDTPLSLDRGSWSYRNSSLMITRTSPTNGIAIEVQDSFRITATVVPIGAEESRIHGYGITNDDCFAHLDLRFNFYSLSDVVDGVLGQTYRRNYVSKIKVSANMPVMGNIPKYSTSGIFATDCAVSLFDRQIVVPEMVSG